MIGCGKRQPGATLPLYANAEAIIRLRLTSLEPASKTLLQAIGEFTDQQFADINAVRRGLSLHEIGNKEIVFDGRHLYNSRQKDGYTIEDMCVQIVSALSASSLIFANPKMTCVQNPNYRVDGYGNKVRDRAVFELTQRKPRAELFSVIPKGDSFKPVTQKGPPSGEPSADEPG
jgi:hypothetical protein